MRNTITTIAILAVLAIKESSAFSINNSNINNKVSSPLLKKNVMEATSIKSKSSPLPKKTMGQIVLERSDTLRTAGFYEDSNENRNMIDGHYYPPLVAGAKTNIGLFLAAMGYKWYRSIFINKLAIWERQPQWNTVITSKEDEEKANLEAMTCNECGSTIFIAKGRKWFQMPNGYTCYCCGATGEDAFTNTREDLLEEIDDDYFDYEKPLDFVTAAERKQLMKQAGGDVEKANALLTQSNAASTDSDAAAADDGAAKKKKKKKKKQKKKKKKVVEEEDAGADVKATLEGNADSSSPSTGTEGDSEAPSKKANDDDDLDALGMD